MNPIRPSILPPSPQGTSAQDAAKLAAVRAFFAAATGQGGAPAATAASAPTAAPVATAPATWAAPAEMPQKFLRPGSLVDIRV